MVLWTPPDSDPADDLYCNSKSLYPDTKTMLLAEAITRGGHQKVEKP